MTRRALAELRSQRWFASQDMRGFAHRQRTQQMGMRREEFLNKPVVAILNTWSDMSPCHAHLRDRAEAVKRGVWQAGGYPVELPALSVGEVMVKPTTMLYRNFLAMEAEEILRSHPVDGAVLLGGCDKSTPGLLMGAISMDIPVIYLSGRPHVQRPVAGSKDRRRNAYQEVLGRAARRQHLTAGLGRSRKPDDALHRHLQYHGHGLHDDVHRRRHGLDPPGRVLHPGRRQRSSAHGVRLRRPHRRDDLGRPEALASSRCARASGTALSPTWRWAARRMPPCTSSPWRAGQASTSPSTTCRRWPARFPFAPTSFPSGEYLMEDFYFAGGLLALLKKLEAHLDSDALTVNGKTLGENLAGADCWNDDVIRDPSNPVVPLSRGKTLAVLRGNLAPNGAVMKSSAANPKFLKHVGPAIVFDNPAEMNAAIDDPDLEVTRGQRACSAQCGAGRRSGHAGMGQSADPQEAPDARHSRHGPHLRRPHERHPLRNLHSPRCPGGGDGRSVGACSGPATSSSSMLKRLASTCGWMKPNWNAGGPRGSRLRRCTDVPLRRCTSVMSRRPTKAATSIS